MTNYKVYGLFVQLFTLKKKKKKGADIKNTRHASISTLYFKYLGLPLSQKGN
jgi:hypothetical protein